MARVGPQRHKKKIELVCTSFYIIKFIYFGFYWSFFVGLCDDPAGSKSVRDGYNKTVKIS